MITKADALQSLRPKAEWVLRGDVVEWYSQNISQPTETEITAEVARLQTEYDNNEYQRQRVTEYPTLADFADAYYWAQKGDNTLMDAYIAKCDAVKTKYSKV
jgi:hypothetical protein